MQWLNLTDPLIHLTPLWGVVALLAALRLTNILYEEEIATPIRWLFGVRHGIVGGIYQPVSYPDNFIGHLWECPRCLSVWVSLLVAPVWLIFPYLLLPFALSGGVILLREGLPHG